MGNMFDGIDLDELANSENAQVEPGIPPSKNEPVDDTPQEVVSETPEIEVPGIDIDKLAELDAPEVVNEKDEDGNYPDDINEKKTPKSDDGASLSSHNVYNSLASALTEAGVFSSLTEEDLSEVESVEGIISLVEKQIKANEHADLNDTQKEYLEALRIGVPLEVYSQRKSNAEQYKGIDDGAIRSNTQLAVELVRRNFRVRGFSEEDSIKYANLSAKSDSFIEDALTAKNALVAYEEGLLREEMSKAAKVREEEEAKEQMTLDSLKSKINETSEIIPGIKVNSTTKAKVFESLTTPVSNGQDGKPLNEVMKSYAEDPEYKMKLHAIHVLTKGFTDFSKFSKTSRSKAVEKLEETLNQGGNGFAGGRGNAGSAGSLTGGQTSKEIADILSQMDFRPKH